jgi:hypothetical protein
MIKIALAGLLLSTISFAECTYSSKNTKVTWNAFKTYEKIGVGGSFDKIVFFPKSAKSIDELLTSNDITIQTSSINSSNAGRDATLVVSFFKTQNTNTIEAKVISAKEGKALVEITMNSVTKKIPMHYRVDGDKIIGKGVIDLGDFSMLPSLMSINKACYDLHAGKTWQDVEIGFEIAISNNC